MKSFILAVASCLMLAVQVFGQQISISKDHYVPNRMNGFCGHCAIETVCRHFGFEQGYDRVQRLYDEYGEDGGGMLFGSVMTALKDYGITYKQLPTGSGQHLYGACLKKLPCIVNLNVPSQTNPGVFRPVRHLVILVGYYSDYVALINSNHSELQWMTRERFDWLWTGQAVAVFPIKK